jgi:hypothetical protein
MRVQGARASPGSPRIQTVIRADPRKADVRDSSKKRDEWFSIINNRIKNEFKGIFSALKSLKS